MIHTYDMTKLGQKLKEYRLASGMTQKEVTELSSVSRDTIRRIEHGHVIPRYDTIIILSKIYRFDLMKLFNHYALNDPLLKYYELIDVSVLSSDIASTKAHYESIKRILAQPESILNLVIFVEAQQMMKLFESLIVLIETDSEDKEAISTLTTEGILLRHKGFNIDNYKDYKYNFIELRLLLIFAYSTNEDQLHVRTEILNFLLAQFNMESRDYDEIKLILKTLYNLSYNHYRLENDEQALIYSEKGLQFAKNKHSSYLKAHLLGRKGLAMFYLDMTGYKDILNQSLILLDIEGNSKLKALFYTAYTQHHKINL